MKFYRWVTEVAYQRKPTGTTEATTDGLPQVARLHRRMRDFVSGGSELFWQRQSMFVGASLLTGYYFSARIAIFCYGLLLLSEAVDYLITRKVLAWNDPTPQTARYFMGWITFSTVLSAGSVSLFTILVARQEGISYHFTPLLFMFSAAIFAAMYNHQLVRILTIRLAIYGATLIYIPARDLWISDAAIQSHLWLQFATTLFVLYFIVDCGLVFLRLYRKNLDTIDALRQEHEKTKRAFEAKSRFLAVVSHELRTPLTSIKGGLDIVNSGVLGDVPDNMKTVLDAAQKNSHRLADLIDDLLDLQKIDAGEMSFKMAEVDLVSLVSDALSACKSYGELAKVSFRFEAPPDRPRVFGDSGRLMQVLANLLSNAAKFSAPGDEVVLRVEQNAGKVRICVEDHGIGIPPNAKSKVFGRFSQVDSSDRRRIGGTGLGMNITRQIVMAHSGSIDYDSELGKGTTFWVELELLAPTAQPRSDAPDGDTLDLIATPA